jgi:predicted HAD superfamily phosphohydrolase YqeG
MKSIELGKRTKSKVLVFDMDETLVSAWKAPKEPDPYFQRKCDFTY